MVLYINNGRQIFPKIKTVINELVCVKNIFIQQPSKLTLEPSYENIPCATKTEPATPLNIQKYDIVDYKTC